MVDIHSHILPGVDDGAIDEAMTLNMLRMAEEDGTRVMIATPHYFYPHYIASQEEIEKKVEAVNGLCRHNNIDIEVLPGREIMLDNYTLQDIEQGHMGSLNNTQYLLVELSMHEWKPYYLDLMYELQLQGYRLIIAHPERYNYIQEDITMLNPLIKEGAIFQLNAGSMTGFNGRKVQRTARELVRQGVVQLIASDAHSDRMRNPRLQEALAEVEKIDPHMAKKMIDYPYKILGEKAIKSNGVRVYQRKLFGLFSKSG